MANWKDLLVVNPTKVWEAVTAPVKVDKTPERRRNKTLEGIDNAIKQLKAGEGSPKRGWYRIAGDMARVTLKSGNKVVAIAGREFQVVPKERAADFYTALRAAVVAGEFDSAIGDAFGEAAAGGTKRSGGWSAERTAAFNEIKAGRAAFKANEKLGGDWSDAKKDGWNRAKKEAAATA